MSSFDNKFTTGSSDSGQTQPSSSFGSRPSNTLARLAFNIYGSANSSGPSNSSPVSVRGSPSYSRQLTPTPPPPPPGPQAFPEIPYHKAPGNGNHKRFKASFDLTSFSLLHNDIQEFAVISGKNSLQVLDLSTMKVLNDLLSTNYAMKNKKVIGSILDVATGYHNNNRFVATSTTTGSILIFNVQASSKTNNLTYKLSDHSRAVNSVNFSQMDQNLLLSGSQDGQMKLWDLRSNSMKPTVTMYGNADAVRCLKFSPFNSKKFVSIFDSGVIQKWDIRQSTQFEKKLNAHTGPGLTLDWHPELDYVVSGGRDKQLQVWNMNSNDTRQIPEHVIYTSSAISKVSFRPNSNITDIGNAEIATSFLNNDVGQAQIYSLKRKYIPLFTLENHTGQITGLDFQNESTLLTCSKDRYFVMDDLSNYRPTVENLSIASTTWSPENGLLYVNQAVQNHSLIEEFDHPSASSSSAAYNPPQQRPSLHEQNSYTSNASTSPNSNSYVSNTMSSTASVNFPGSNLMGTPMAMTPSHPFDQTPPPPQPPLLSPRPGHSRASTQFRRPTLNKSHSHGSEQPSNSSRHPSYTAAHPIYQPLRQLHDNLSQVLNPYAVPVDLPINKTIDDLDYLVNNYIFDPSEKPLVEICQFNSSIALDVGNLRDAQTWNVIKESLIWESSLDEKLHYGHSNQEGVFVTASAHGDTESFRSDSISHDVINNVGHYSTSNSTNYGKSPSLSDLSEFNISSVNSTNRAQSFSSSFKVTSLKQSILKHNPNEMVTDDVIEEEGDTVNPAVNNTVIIESDPLKWEGIEPGKSSSASKPEEKDDENSIEFSDSKSIPILNSKRIRRTSSIGARSISPTFSIDSSASNNSQSLFRPFVHKNNLQLSPMPCSSPMSSSVASYSNSRPSSTQTPQTQSAMESSNAQALPASLPAASYHQTHQDRHKIKTQKSNISELTRQLTSNLDLNSSSPSTIHDYKIPPYAPNKLIEKSIEFSIEQGDLIMCCTLLLLFNGKYKIYGTERLKEIIFSYLTYLQRLRFFIQFTKISIFLNENKQFQNLDIDLTTVSKTSSSIRHFCSNCGKLITNEETKANILKGLNGAYKAKTSSQTVGTWFCESCSARNKCIYCNEILKKLSLIKLKCGHNGHFGCLKQWFVDLEMEECPAGCI